MLWKLIDEIVKCADEQSKNNCVQMFIDNIKKINKLDDKKYRWIIHENSIVIDVNADNHNINRTVIPIKYLSFDEIINNEIIATDDGNINGILHNVIQSATDYDNIIVKKTFNLTFMSI